ncbi:MAG: hypothetical protein ACYTG0_01710 [Planctomycetota bacterium]|jgi:hypothetical protein
MTTDGLRPAVCGAAVAAILLGTAAAESAVVTVRLAADGINVIELEDGTAVLEFDRLSLPADARVYQARLLCRREPIDGRHPEARVDVAIHPMTAPYRKDTRPTAEAQPLPLVGPWYGSFEMTAVVRGWLGGTRPVHALFVKTFPGWRKETTCLDVMYEGTPSGMPPQVTGLKAVHHAGQTFVTWREIDDLVGRDKVTWGELKPLVEEAVDRGQTAYCVYRSERPITAQTLQGCERIAVVRPLSCWNVQGRSVERPIDDTIGLKPALIPGQGNPFGRAHVDGPYGLECPVDRFVIPGRDKPLPRGTGLYVNTIGNSPEPAEAHYAVVTSVDGVQNTIDFSSANATTQPVTETAGEGEPVLQGVLPKARFWNYPDRRLHYVRWAGPPYANLPGRCFNWSVGVPEPLGRDVPLELNLHRDGGSYWRTHYRLERDSIVLSPHDFPLQTWWFGYHESHGTLKSFSQGRIQNYTERRLLQFLEWAAGKWPVDRNRIVVTGVQHSGSAGALRLGLRFPEIFSCVVAGRAVPDVAYFVTDLNTGRNQGRFDRLEALWGKIDWGLKTGGGDNVWEVLNLNRLLTDLPPAADLPLVAMTSSNDWTAADDFYRLMLRKRQPIVAHFAWGGETLLPVSASSTWPNAVRLDVRRNRLLPAFRGASAEPLLDSGKQGDFNLGFRFRSDNVVDRPDRLEITLYWVQLYGNRGQPVADVTFRRRTHFQVEPGRSYRWNSTPLGSPEDLPRTGYWRKNVPKKAAGDVTVGDDGLLTIPGVQFSPLGSRLVVTPK